MKKLWRKNLARIGSLILVLALALCPLAGCDKDPLDPKNPITITIWHYYNGSIETAFNGMVKEFNESTGKQRGVIVEAVSKSSNTELEKQVRASAKGEVGSDRLPDIFSAYADTAYEIEKMGLLADIGKYFTKTEQGEYLESYIEEGKIGLNGELRIFPIAKSSEIFMLNDTDWEPFADAYGYTYADLATYEKLAVVAADYYEWSGGKAFFGRDSMANLFIIAAKEFGKELFQVSGGKGELNIDSTVMKKLWDTYYVPYISGYYYASGRFRSDDAKMGDILSYVGSTASANYSPTDVTISGSKHSISPKMLPVPHYEGGAKVQIQQGAGMVVTKTDNKHEYASVLFLKWFTDITTNTAFAAMNGYVPVKKAASNYNSMISIANQKDITINSIMEETLNVTFDAISTGTLYTNKAFDGGAPARTILDTHLQSKADADRLAVIALVKNGTPHSQAVAQYNTTQAFDAWLSDFTEQLRAVIS